MARVVGARPLRPPLRTSHLSRCLFVLMTPTPRIMCDHNKIGFRCHIRGERKQVLILPFDDETSDVPLRLSRELSRGRDREIVKAEGRPGADAIYFHVQFTYGVLKAWRVATTFDAMRRFLEEM